MAPIIEQLDDGKLDSRGTTEHAVGESIGPPRGLLITEHRQAYDRLPVAVVDPVVVDKHPFGELSIALILDFDMDENPRFLPILEPDLEELVGEAQTEFRLAHNLLQFLVQRFIIPAPVNRRVRSGKKNLRKWRKKCSSTSFQGLS